MAGRTLTPAGVPTTYAQLRDAVIAVVVKGRAEIDRAWVQTYHETGRLINEHVLLFRERADYGAKTFSRLVKDTGIDIHTLRQCVRFHRTYPIRGARLELGWGHYRLLLQIADDTQRKAIEAETIKKHWTTRELETRVRSANAVALESGEKSAAQPVELLTPRRGTPGLHPIVDRGDGPVVDLGFKLYRALGPASKPKAPSKVEGLTTADIVRLNDDPSTSLRAGGVRRVDGATKDQLFTYAATIRRIVDGDTFVVSLAVAPGIMLELKLRLRGLDCPEMATAAGRAAKRFVDDLIKPGDEVIVATTKPDKYDRYLADVFVPGTTGEVFLNNALLEAGHAVRYDGGAKEE